MQTRRKACESEDIFIAHNDDWTYHFLTGLRTLRDYLFVRANDGYRPNDHWR